MKSIASLLKFEKINNPPDSLDCNCCGRKRSNSWLMATIKPFVDESAEYSVTVCGDTCRSNLLKHPAVEDYLCNAIARASIAGAGSLKDEFELYTFLILTKLNT